MPPDSFSYHIEHFGDEKEPVIVMDNFSGKLDLLLRHAQSQKFSPGSAYYPGVQAQADVNYLTLRRKELPQIMRDVFDIQHGLNIESCVYALVTRPPETLTPGQRLPHHDGNEGNLFALLHYIQGAEDAGTAFYRHRRTGFETVTEERAETYRAALKEDAAEFGMPPAQYFYGDDARYEMIGEIKARPDRAILYRGRTLHSGCIPLGTTEAASVETARITLNTFIWDTAA
jgi:hypothetical protein